MVAMDMMSFLKFPFFLTKHFKETNTFYLKHFTKIGDFYNFIWIIQVLTFRTCFICYNDVFFFCKGRL